MTAEDINVFIESLIKLDDPAWGKILLSRDPKFDKINQEDVHVLVNGAMEYAKELFQSYVVFTGLNPSTFAEQEGITVKMDDALLMEEYLYFGHYFSHPPTIEVSQVALEKTAAVMEEINLSLNLKEVIIAHEVFHHLEAKNGFQWRPRAMVRIPVFGRFMRAYHVRRFSEVAAVHFSKLWLGASFCPAIFDILLVYSVNPERARGLAYEQLQRGGR